MAEQARRRRAGSVRFDPYYKVQYRDVRAHAWVDVQQSFGSEQEAALAAPGVIPQRAKSWRLMRIAPEGREPVMP